MSKQKDKSSGGFVVMAGLIALVAFGQHPGHGKGLHEVLDSAAAVPAGSGCHSRDSVRVGQCLAARDYGWTGRQFGCLNALWTHESGWRWNADNPQSGAYGIPQALPASKMASAGGDWQTNPATQIRWGLGYIAGRYGSPCGAWSFEMSHYPNWY